MGMGQNRSGGSAAYGSSGIGPSYVDYMNNKAYKEALGNFQEFANALVAAAQNGETNLTGDNVGMIYGIWENLAPGESIEFFYDADQPYLVANKMVASAGTTFGGMMIELPGASYVQTNGGNDFIYFNQSDEGTAYKWMLIWQKRSENEIAAYHVINGSGSKGILILPWGGNSKEGSNVLKRQAMRGVITDDHGNRYKPLASIHTHPIYGQDDIMSSLLPSDEDMQTIRDIGLPGFILTDVFYIQINTSIRWDQHTEPLGETQYLINLDHGLSLFSK